MPNDVENLRIHFYGVQGSGSIFPSREERLQTQNHCDLDLLSSVFEDISARQNSEGAIAASVEDILGGPINRKNLQKYRDKFQLAEPRVYGGWTTCFRIETADGYDIVLDCGSGFRNCANDIVRKWGDDESRELFIFGSHAHFDHTEGFDQAAVCFDPRNKIHVSADRQYLQALDQNLGIFSHHIDINLKGIQTPLNYELMPASFDSCEIRDLKKHPIPDERDPMVGRYHDINEPITLGETTIQPFEVFHPNTCLGYRIERKGKVFVFCTDHELRRGEDPNDPLQIASLEAEERLKQQAMNADVLYRDGQFLQIEYDGHQGIGSPFGVSRLDWGHSCIEDVIAMAEDCNIKHTYIGHHDPNRTWAERNWIDETLARRSEQSARKFELSQSETIIDL
jgi:phosphoribosyl 1,2-cyclic phosphodiesterase